MQENIKKILEAAALAPSGDNSQPWKFKVNGNSIEIYNIPAGDNSVYNYKERGSLIAHGALIENVTIAAKHFGYETELILFPTDNVDFIAKVELIQQSIKENLLFESIDKRCTNRKPYQPDSILSDHKNKLLSLEKESGISRFFLVEDKQKINELSKTLCLSERLILENYHIHKGLFEYIRWTKQSEDETKTGMYIKTLELPLPAQKAFKLFSHWPIINFLNNFNISALVAKDSAKLYAATPAFGMITIPDTTPLTFVSVGRMLQRIWLTATSLGLSLQPVGALLYLAQRINDGDTKLFSEKQENSILEAESKIKQLFGIENEIPAMMFRIGYSDLPTARSQKRPPLIINDD